MFKSTKIIELGSCAFRQPRAKSHCSFLHGYRLTAKFWFEANELDENNWVVDFGGLRKLKLLMEDMFDHTTVIARDDPHLPLFMELEDKEIIVLNIMEKGVGIERFAEWCCNTANDFVQELTNGRCRCVKAEVFEHEKNSAIYEMQTIQVSTNNQAGDSVNTEKVIDIKSKPRQKRPVDISPQKQSNTWINKEAPNTWGL